MATLRTCADKLPHELVDLVKQFAAAWKESSDRPHPNQEVLFAWDELLLQWVAEASLPLYVRKFADNRGQKMVHPSGRVFVPTDNSPAQWAFSLACAGEIPTLTELEEKIAGDQLPIAMMLKSTEKQSATYRCSLSAPYDVNKKGWKLAHIDGVGLNSRALLSALPIDVLHTQFLRFMAPSNMFLVPKRFAGIAEIDEVIDAFRKAGP